MAFNVVHKIVAIEHEGEVCVADRENGRLQCIKYGNDTSVQVITNPAWGKRLFSLSYSPALGKSGD